MPRTSLEKFALETLNFTEKNCPIVYNWTATERLLHQGRNKLKDKVNRTLNILYLGWIEEEKVFLIFEAVRNFIKSMTLKFQSLWRKSKMKSKNSSMKKV